MHLKQKGYCFGVLLVNTIITMTLPSAGRCGPTVHSNQPDPQLALRHDRSGGSATEGLSQPADREAGERPHGDSRPVEKSTNLPDFHNSDNTDGTQADTSEGPGYTIGANTASSAADRGFKTRKIPERGEGQRLYTSIIPPDKECRKGDIEHVVLGKFYITGQLEPNPNVGFQSDSAVSVQAQGGQERVRGQRVSASEEIWQRLQPVVECGDAMTLTVRKRRAVQLQLDRVNESSVPLSQLQPHCGYSVQTTWRDLSLRAQYDACHVTQEDDSFVLPLLWRGTPVKMSCPASEMQPQATGPSSLCCSPYGMTVKVQGLHDTEELRVNVRGEWTPLVALAEQCGYILDRQHAETVIAAPFVTCGITVKDGKYTLSLQVGEKTFTLSCPVSVPEALPLTHHPPVTSPQHLTRKPAAQQSLEPFPWAPPFYLAPPYYPHPTYNLKSPQPDGLDAYNPPTPSSLSPDNTFGPHPLPPVDSPPDYPVYSHYHTPVEESYKHVHVPQSSTDEAEVSSLWYPDLQQKQKTPVFGVSEKPSAASPLQPPSHAFNPYYHYYHHPKIPLPGPPQDPDPGPEVPREVPLNNPHNYEYPMLPPQQSESPSLQFVPQAASHPYTLPTSPPETSAPHTPDPPQPYPYFYYFPHVARGEARRLAPLTLDTAAKTNLSDHQNTKSAVSVSPLPRSQQDHDDFNLNPYIDHLREVINEPESSPEVVKHPLLSEDDDDDDDDYDDYDVEEELDDIKRHSAPPTPKPPGPVPPPEQPSNRAPSPDYDPSPYPYYLHPYYHYYQMYYGPDSLHTTENHVSPTSKEALDPPLPASPPPPQPPSDQHQTTPPTTKSMYDVHNGLLHPYYYYYHHLFYHPKASEHNQDPHPAGSVNSETTSKPESPLHSDYSGMDWMLDPSMSQLLHSHFYNLSAHYITQQHAYYPFGHPGEEEGTEERLDSEMKDQANPSTPSASPCGLGPVSDSDGSISLGCCSYPVKDCTMGPYLIFSVPDSVLEPTVAPPAHPSEVSNVSCTLQKLTSDPDIYTVPLDGCGVNKHVFGEKVVHLLEVNGIHSLQQAQPVRLMVECSSSPGSPGEVRLHVMDEPPPPPVQSAPAPATVQLRIAKDESFTSFHPETHLPLSLMRGRTVYVELSLLDPPVPGLVLLVHSCLAYTQAPYTSWLPIYDGCLEGSGDSQLLPSPRSDPHHTRRILISGFLSLPSESPSYPAEGGSSHLYDPEIHLLCLTEVCSTADGDCSVSCINSPISDV
ncbi:uncharacterized protein LOC131984182 [Centropristis striata]|uniref:uncharacterized protein LOC131984182 n=1 Tax=Centropristis striata TaxID=184440 RepID=UPI0027E1764B|nr:uncharacterized protein LOC131984182 [Centropristis striata]